MAYRWIIKEAACSFTFLSISRCVCVSHIHACFLYCMTQPTNFRYIYILGIKFGEISMHTLYRNAIKTRLQTLNSPYRSEHYLVRMAQKKPRKREKHQNTETIKMLVFCVVVKNVWKWIWYQQLFDKLPLTILPYILVFNFLRFSFCVVSVYTTVFVFFGFLRVSFVPFGFLRFYFLSFDDEPIGFRLLQWE